MHGQIHVAFCGNTQNKLPLTWLSEKSVGGDTVILIVHCVRYTRKLYTCCNVKRMDGRSIKLEHSCSAEFSPACQSTGPWPVRGVVGCVKTSIWSKHNQTAKYFQAIDTSSSCYEYYIGLLCAATTRRERTWVHHDGGPQCHHLPYHHLPLIIIIIN